MTPIESKLIELGNALRHSIGHATNCPKLLMQVPCTCGAGGEQAKAIDDWIQAVKDFS